MNPLVINRPQPVHGEAQVPTHADFPIAQAFHNGGPLTQQQLLQQAVVVEPQDALILIERNGLRALARTESVLNRVAGTLRRRFGPTLVAGPPEVRYGHGHPTLEPHMAVLVHGPSSHFMRVRADFLSRRGRITGTVERSMFVLEGEAPLADLLGYYDRVRDLLGQYWNRRQVAMWLSRYAPIEWDGPEAA